MRGGGLQTPSKRLQQLEGLLAARCPHPGAVADGQACDSTFSVLCGALCPTGAGGNLLPSSAPVAAACCRGAELRSWRQ